MTRLDQSYFDRSLHELKIAHFQTTTFFLSNYGVSFDSRGLSCPNKVENWLIYFLDIVIWNREHGG